MRKHYVLLCICIVNVVLNGMEKSLVKAAWFSGNLATCLLAQKKSSEYWASFDELLDIVESQRIVHEKIDNTGKKEKKTALIRTDNVTIGDIFYFLPLVYELKKRTGWEVIMSVTQFFKGALLSVARAYGADMVSVQDEQPIVDYTGHLIALLGHLHMAPAAIHPERVMLTAPDRSFRAVTQIINPILLQGKSIAAVFLDENCQEVLSSVPFKQLARNNSDLVIMDCCGQNGRVVLDEDQKNQYLVLPEQEQTFDTIIALGRIMSVRGNIVGFGSDNERASLCACSLSQDAQERMAFIVPNIQNYDVREEGDGVHYKQMISNCWMYQCNTLADQLGVISCAYKNMLENQ